MKLFDKIRNYVDKQQHISREKEKGRNIFLLNKELPIDADVLIIEGYEKAKLDDQRKKIKIINMKLETERMKQLQKLNAEKLGNTIIKNKLKKERGEDDFSF